MATGRVDLVIGVRSNIPADAMSTHLFEDDFVCVVRAGHPTVKKKLSLEQYTSLSHVLISPAGTPGSVVDEALARKGLSRRIAVRTHTFLAAPRVVASTDLVLTGPRRVLTAMARVDGLQLLPPPIGLRSVAVLMAWPRAHAARPRARVAARVGEARRDRAATLVSLTDEAAAPRRTARAWRNATLPRRDTCRGAPTPVSRTPDSP